MILIVNYLWSLQRILTTYHVFSKECIYYFFNAHHCIKVKITQRDHVTAPQQYLQYFSELKCSSRRMRSPSSAIIHSNDGSASKKTSIVGLEGDYVKQIKPSSRDETIEQLDGYYGLVKRQLLKYQSPTSHLFPSQSSNTEHANIRDSIYCSAAVWSLYQVGYGSQIITA